MEEWKDVCKMKPASSISHDNLMHQTILIERCWPEALSDRPILGLLRPWTVEVGLRSGQCDSLELCHRVALTVEARKVYLRSLIMPSSVENPVYRYEYSNSSDDDNGVI